MSVTTTSPLPPQVSLDEAARTRGVRLIPASAHLVRVCAPSGRIYGHVRQIEGPDGPRLRAEVYRADVRAFRAVGEFWRADDALQALTAA